MSSAHSTPVQVAQRRLLIVAAAALVVTAALGLLNPRGFFHGYLAAFIFWAATPLGALPILMAHDLTGGRWGWSIRRPLVAAALTAPLLVLLFAPLLLGFEALFPWSRPERVAASHVLQHQRQYLNEPAFVLRAAVFFFVWCVLAWLLTRRGGPGAQGRPDGAAAAPRTGRLRSAISAAGLIAYFLTMSFAAVDWLASLKAEFYASMIGLYLIAAQLLTSLAVMVLLSARLTWRIELLDWIARLHRALRRSKPVEPAPDTPSAGEREPGEPLSGQREAGGPRSVEPGPGGPAPGRPLHDEPAGEPLDANTLNDLGNLLLTVVVLHAYIAFAQFFIVWNGNLPAQAAWYAPRSHGAWAVVTAALMLLQFGLPFAALLFRALKREPRSLLAIVAVALAGQLLEATWLVIPSAEDSQGWAVLYAVGCLVGLGAAWLAAFLWTWTLAAPRAARAEEPAL